MFKGFFTWQRYVSYCTFWIGHKSQNLVPIKFRKYICKFNISIKKKTAKKGSYICIINYLIEYVFVKYKKIIFYVFQIRPFSLFISLLQNVFSEAEIYLFRVALFYRL